MNTKINKSFKSKVITLISVALVISFFAIPIVGIISSNQDIIESENRRIYQFPEISIKSLSSKKFLYELSKYFEDRLLFRFSLNSLTEPVYNKKFFKGFEANKQGLAIEGLDNWLFLSSDKYYKQHTEDVPFNSQRQKFIVNKIKKVQDLAQGVPTYIIVGPDKLGIYPEKAVPWIGHPGKYRLANKKIRKWSEINF